MSSVREDPETDSATDAARRRRISWLVSLTLALITLVAFAPALDCGFVLFDDPLYVTQSPYAQEGLSWPGAAWAFRQPYASNWHPFTLLSHMADVEFFGLEPRGHHLTSVVLHMVNVLLVFAVFQAMTGKQAASALAAALFAVHPLRVESVAWVSERKDVLCGLFFLLTLAAYIRWVRRGGRGSYALLLACFTLALLAKPMAVTLPCVLLLLDIWPLGRLPLLSAPGWRNVRTLVLEKLPLFALSAVAAWATVRAQGETIEISQAMSPAARLANAVVAYGRYLAKTAWPQDLACFYPFPDSLPAWQVAISAAAIAGLTWVAWRIRRRTAAALVGWLWFLGVLVPVIGLLKVGDQAMADRYTYLPSIGLCVGVVWAGATVRNKTLRRGLALLAVLTVLLWVPRTRAQVMVWSDTETLFRNALRVTERNYLAHLNLGEELRSKGHLDEALEHFRAAVDLRPDLSGTHGALGQALRLAGRPAEAIPHLRRSLAAAPGDIRSLWNLASALVATGQKAEAEIYLRRMLQLDPTNPQALWGMAQLAPDPAPEVKP